MHFWKAKPPTSPKRQPFGTVQGRPDWLLHYRGAIAATPGVEHRLICSEVRPELQSALLEQGFRPIAGRLPTHGLFCTSQMGKDKGQPRCLFNLYLDTSGYSEHEGRWIAKKVAQGLKQALVRQKSPDFVIRCRHEDEYPWCQDDRVLDEYWFMEAGAHLRWAIAVMK